MPIDQALTPDEWAFLKPSLARAYATLSEATLSRDVKVLEEMQLVVRADDEVLLFRANTDTIRMPRRRRIDSPAAPPGS